MSPPQPAGQGTLRTPLHHWQAAHGARFVERAGWQVVAAYRSVDEETKAAHAGVGLADLSAFAKLSVRGRGVTQLASALLGDGPARKPRGVSVLAGANALACRLTDEHLLLLAESTDVAPLTQIVSGVKEELAIVETDATSAYAGFGLVGPRLEEVLRRLTALDLGPASLPQGACAETSLAGVHALLVRPTDTKLPVVRVYVGWELGEYIWEELHGAGRDAGLQPIGLDSWQQLLG